ncbi:thioesterase [Chitinophaga oryziterrae]|uniref:Thioesterase n=1 Tax=Chitinophaga oryziterrae TaxID=1031224 RepID=A0A6N8JAH7_9BACT|nr:thioesterase domain-containing protein [Chitinophaga oryziterrae]MVT42257.1 thioesterase [Chitinophaga oryziterrae]
MKPQLFLIHFAGGNIYSFQFMKPYLSAFELVPLELPGRGKRVDEELINDFDEATLDIYNQLTGNLYTNRFFIYGHSLGALLTLRVTAMLEQNGRFPESIIVTGNPGPGERENKQLYLMEKDDFKKELLLMGGIPEVVLDNEELFDFYEPILRADLEIIEKRGDLSFAPVKARISAIMGSEEEKSSRIENWKNFGLSDVRTILLPGNHFFIHNYAAQLCNIIGQACYSPPIFH